MEELSATDFYPPLFTAAFGTPEVTSERMSRALAQFMRSLISHRSRFDQAFTMKQPPESVLTEQERRGHGLFFSNCGSACHKDEVQAVEFPSSNGLDIVSADPGVGEGEFRVHSLRNVAVSGPYMHDGRFATLAEVIEHYSSGVKGVPRLHSALRPGGLKFTAQQKAELEAFLLTLTDSPMLTDPKFSDPFQLD